MFHSVIIATKGRPAILQGTLASLAAQDCPPDEIIISVTDEADAANAPRSNRLRVLVGPPGLCTQRNTGIRAVDPACELVTFLDDDIELAPGYCRELRSFAEKNPGVSGIGGELLLDGATRTEAVEILQRTPVSTKAPYPASSLYGCNMSYRRSSMQDEWFDERLTLYAWLEDFDYSTRLARKGRLVMVPQMPLCHLRTSSGRMSHRRFGFAQVMNPWYLASKGIIPRNELWKTHVLGGLTANLFHFPRDPANRGERLRGNFRALAMIASGKINPEAINLLS